MKIHPIIAACTLFFLLQCVEQSTAPQPAVNVSGVNCGICHGADFSLVLATYLHALHCNVLYAGAGCDSCHPDDSKTHTTIDGMVMMKDSLPLLTTTVCDPCHGKVMGRNVSGW